MWSALGSTNGTIADVLNILAKEAAASEDVTGDKRFHTGTKVW